MTYPLPKVIRNCLLTLNNIRIEWNGPDTMQNQQVLVDVNK